MERCSCRRGWRGSWADRGASCPESDEVDEVDWTWREFLPCLCRGGGPCEAWWRGPAEPEDPLHRASRGPPPREISGRNQGARKRPSGNGGEAAGASCHRHPGLTTLSLSLVGGSVGLGEEPAGPWALAGGPWRKPFGSFPSAGASFEASPGPDLIRSSTVRAPNTPGCLRAGRSASGGEPPSAGFPCLASGDRADSGRGSIWHAYENKSRTFFTQRTIAAGMAYSASPLSAAASHAAGSPSTPPSSTPSRAATVGPRSSTASGGIAAPPARPGASAISKPSGLWSPVRQWP
jgi:hypothetical protein